ncbi:iron chaperone [Massilia sp. CCM 8733]|uniref:Iron chaperone n=1 Tax=Massilia mucilaginosa TaxID=2609282 RepID=A0ABX0NSH4_9BURK|nr:iron chaperone [Massilia mucilaginosa]NHZ89856.1 iron chaperone [Massilia mucilaginosa]
MSVFSDYLAKMNDPAQRARTSAVLDWVGDTFPALERRIAWNQPMFSDHGTFIIGFSTARHHLAVAPEAAAIAHFASQIRQAGYEHTTLLIRIAWSADVDFALLKTIVGFNIADKAGCATFWRKQAKPGAAARNQH